MAKFTNETFYQGVLTNGPGTSLTDRPYAQAMQKYFAKKFPNVPATTSVLVRVKSEATMNSNSSYYNLRSATVILDVLQEVLRKKIVPGQHITIMAFYKAQVELLRIAIDNLHRAKPRLGANEVKVRTVDGMQGAENHLILLDVVSTHAIGFLRQRNRMNVATSRAKDSMMVFANVKTLMRFDKDKRPFISHLLDYYQHLKLDPRLKPSKGRYLPQTYTNVEAMYDEEAFDEDENGPSKDDAKQEDGPTPKDAGAETNEGEEKQGSAAKEDATGSGDAGVQGPTPKNAGADENQAEDEAIRSPKDDGPSKDDVDKLRSTEEDAADMAKMHASTDEARAYEKDDAETHRSTKEDSVPKNDAEEKEGCAKDDVKDASSNVSDDSDIVLGVDSDSSEDEANAKADNDEAQTNDATSKIIDAWRPTTDPSWVGNPSVPPGYPW